MSLRHLMSYVFSFVYVSEEFAWFMKLVNLAYVLLFQWNKRPWVLFSGMVGLFLRNSRVYKLGFAD